MADNYPEAAWKHVTDSEALLAAKRYDGAGYLAGYAVECTLKTLIWVESGRGRGGHNLTHLSGTAVHLLSLPGSKDGLLCKAPECHFASIRPGRMARNTSLRSGWLRVKIRCRRLGC